MKMSQIKVVFSFAGFAGRFNKVFRFIRIRPVDPIEVKLVFLFINIIGELILLKLVAYCFQYCRGRYESKFSSVMLAELIAAVVSLWTSPRGPHWWCSQASVSVRKSLEFSYSNIVCCRCSRCVHSSAAGSCRIHSHLLWWNDSFDFSVLVCPCIAGSSAAALRSDVCVPQTILPPGLSDAFQSSFGPSAMCVCRRYEDFPTVHSWRVRNWIWCDLYCEFVVIRHSRRLLWIRWTFA